MKRNNALEKECIDKEMTLTFNDKGEIVEVEEIKETPKPNSES